MLGRVLVVDDDPVQQLVLTRMVESCGAQAMVTGDGRSALEAAATFEFDLILMDAQMPGMHGTDVTRALRRRVGGATSPLVPVIGVTGEDVLSHLPRFLAAGMDDALAKPVRRDTVQAILDRWIHARRAGSGVAASHARAGAITGA